MAAQVSGADSAAATAQSLVDLATGAGGQLPDDLTVVVVRRPPETGRAVSPVMASDERGSTVNLDALRHDLLNPLNVLAGAATGLLESGLTDGQRAWVQMIQSATTRLHRVIQNVDRYQSGALAEGRARLADLCSIAAARVGKPFDRERLVSAIEEVGGGRRPLRILLVDDSPELVLLVRTYLNRTGWTIDVVESGERAVSQAMTESLRRRADGHRSARTRRRDRARMRSARRIWRAAPRPRRSSR